MIMCTSFKPTRLVRVPRTGPAPKHLDLLAYVACPIKQPFRDHMDEVARPYREATGREIDTHIPMGCRDEDDYEDIANVGTIEELPEVVASVGFGDFMTLDFVG